MSLMWQTWRGQLQNPPHPEYGVFQMAMVLHDQGWQKISIDVWNETTAPNIKGTWNLNNVTQFEKP